MVALAAWEARAARRFSGAADGAVAQRTVVLVADTAADVTELSRLAGAFAAEDDERNSASALFALLGKGTERAAEAAQCAARLVEATGLAGRDGVACVPRRCPSVFERSHRRQAAAPGDGTKVMAVSLRSSGLLADADAAAAALRWAQQSPQWEAIVATVEEVEPAVAALALAPASQGGRRGLADTPAQGIAMTPTVFSMLVLGVAGAATIAGIVSCAMGIQTPSRFALGPLRDGKTF
ncbi:hypothetical protein FNF27_00720 [Cafeteria roenbergensis]|uniref:Uncharacterized protein n=1 Tax=Cafeteria roenbergensis TaxID=33653 RepID=A0A5A8C5K9_CAFRO|nr:hypothetical protein FNF29_07543 [Cafeteria roenbergensis]KAA0177550.1 hypothetical protein FNF27_00720 [Cafeteria roenbergensis]|eukprot:KAA0147171.1 hypothetical protein FNF29_07543 [Cafeteria roenbergensis]